MSNVELKYYDVKLEVKLPATITYRILAESPEKAFELSKRATPTGVKYNIAHKLDIKAIVYDSGTTMIRFIKNFIR